MRGTGRDVNGGRVLSSPPARDAVIWHDVECAAYSEDLRLWEELADKASGPILELGCGTGRVSLYLARRGFQMQGLDLDSAVVDAFNERVGELSARADVEDARAFQLGSEFDLVLLPMQLIQLFATRQERIACLSRAAWHLRPGGTAAVAIAENVLGGTNEAANGSVTDTRVLPDTREIDSWLYSSLPRSTEVDDEEIVVSRLRQVVSPTGELTEEDNRVRLQVLDAATLEREAEAAGLRPAGRRDVPPTDAHVGSTVVLLERE